MFCLCSLQFEETLTGFKWMGNKTRDLQADGAEAIFLKGVFFCKFIHAILHLNILTSLCTHKNKLANVCASSLFLTHYLYIKWKYNRTGKEVLFSFEEAIGFCVGSNVVDKVCLLSLTRMAFLFDMHIELNSNLRVLECGIRHHYRPPATLLQVSKHNNIQCCDFVNNLLTFFFLAFINNYKCTENLGL